MPALIEVTFGTRQPRPGGLLGVPVHGMLYSALEAVSPALSARMHAAEVKGFRIGQTRWYDDPGEGQVLFQVGVLDDSILDPMLEALTVGRTQGDAHTSLWGAVRNVQVTAQTSYDELYSRHAREASGRDLHFSFRTPTTFRANDLDMPFPVPKTVFFGLQRRWEAFSDLHFGPELNDWIARAVRVQDFQLKHRSVHFKGLRGATLSACVGEVKYVLVRPGDAEPTFVRLLSEYANYAGVGYKTTFGLGHVEAWGWELREPGRLQ